MATATPRRFSNQCETSATSGAKVAAALKPIRTWAAANSVSDEVVGASAKPSESPTALRIEGDDDAAAIDQPARHDAAGEEAQHVHGVGEGDVGAADAEIGLHRRQRDGQAPHADAADRAQGHAGGQPPPGVARIDTRHFFDQPPATPWVLTYSA